MKIWPFMFAASPVLEYRFVIQPDFIDGAQEARFREQLALDDTGGQELRTLSVADSKNNAIGCFYRAGPLLHGGEIQTDSVGRKLYSAFGFFSAEPAGETRPEEASRLIDRLTPFFEQSLTAFLNADRGVRPTIVPVIDSSSQPTAQPVPPAAQGPGPKPSRAWRTTSAILGGLLVVFIGLCGVMLLWNKDLDARNSELEKKLEELRAASNRAVVAPPAKPGIAEKPGNPDRPESAEKSDRPEHADRPAEPASPTVLPKNINP